MTFHNCAGLFYFDLCFNIYKKKFIKQIIQIFPGLFWHISVLATCQSIQGCNAVFSQRIDSYHLGLGGCLLFGTIRWHLGYIDYHERDSHLNNTHKNLYSQRTSQHYLKI